MWWGAVNRRCGASTIIELAVEDAEASVKTNIVGHRKDQFGIESIQFAIEIDQEGDRARVEQLLLLAFVIVMECRHVQLQAIVEEAALETDLKCIDRFWLYEVHLRCVLEGKPVVSPAAITTAVAGIDQHIV